MKNPMIMTVIVAMVVGGAAFFGGMQYQKTQVNAPMQGQLRGQNGGQPGGFQGGSGNKQGMMPINGEIISQDDTSITVKMQDGSSKIVILSDNTNINKSSKGTKSDLKTGEKVTAFGTTNSDGSITAQNVSIGGNMMLRGNLGGNTQPTQDN